MASKPMDKSLDKRGPAMGPQHSLPEFHHHLDKKVYILMISVRSHNSEKHLRPYMQRLEIKKLVLLISQ